jgi:hypothetical protein
VPLADKVSNNRAVYIAEKAAYSDANRVLPILDRKNRLGEYNVSQLLFHVLLDVGLLNRRYLQQFVASNNVARTVIEQPVDPDLEQVGKNKHAEVEESDPRHTQPMKIRSIHSDKRCSDACRDNRSHKIDRRPGQEKERRGPY